MEDDGPIRVLVVDDDDIVRRAVCSYLAQADDVEAVATCENGADAVRYLDAHRVEIVLMDITMPVMDGLTATKRILASHPDQRILILTTFDDDTNLIRALKYGAVGFLLKNTTPSGLLQAIRTAHATGMVIAAAPSRRLVSYYLNRHTPDESQAPALTGREQDALLLLARGFSNNQIGRDLGVSESAAKKSVAGLLQKFGVRSRLEVVLAAKKLGVID